MNKKSKKLPLRNPLQFFGRTTYCLFVCFFLNKLSPLIDTDISIQRILLNHSRIMIFLHKPPPLGEEERMDASIFKHRGIKFDESKIPEELRQYRRK